tara:strand:- start:36899 stop:37192 length:294 start_codon:yes stop_codon:yes gene_type:complete
LNVLVFKIKIKLNDSRSLKNKRQFVKSISAIMQKKFNVSIAEVENQDLWQLATLGISITGNSVYHLRSQIFNIVKLIEESKENISIIDSQEEILTGF